MAEHTKFKSSQLEELPCRTPVKQTPPTPLNADVIYGCSSKELEAAMRKIMGDTEYIQELRKMKFAYKKKMEQANDERKQGGNSIDILDASPNLPQVMF